MSAPYCRNLIEFGSPRMPGVSFGPVDAKWCATAGDNVADPVILHDQASRGAAKVTGLQRIVQRLWRGGHAPIGAPCAS